MTTTTFYVETADGGHEIPLIITGTYVPRQVQTLTDPSECAHFDDVEIYIDISDDERGERKILVSEALLAPFSAEELLFEQVREEQRSEIDPSDHYNAMRDEGHRL
jgi:hypothetical protein